MSSGSRRRFLPWLGDASGTAYWVLALTFLLAVGVTAVRLREPTLLATVKVAVGSEDLAFFADPDVQAEFQANNLNVVATPMGSGQTVTAARSGEFDAVLPSSDVYYRVIKAALPRDHYLNAYPAFQTSLVVFTRKKYVKILQSAGIVDQHGDFDVTAYLAKLRTGTVTWGQFPGLKPSDPLAARRIILRMTDPNDSDSGAMFAAYAAYLLNGNQAVDSDTGLRAVTPKIRPEFSQEGNAPLSTQYAYDEFVSGSAPLELGYQSEAADRSSQPGQGFPADATPLPLVGGGVNCVHTLLALNPDGNADKLGNGNADQLGNLLRTDPVLLRRERAHGFNLPGSATTVPIPSGQWLGKLIADVTPNG